MSDYRPPRYAPPAGVYPDIPTPPAAPEQAKQAATTMEARIEWMKRWYRNLPPAEHRRGAIRRRLNAAKTSAQREHALKVEAWRYAVENSGETWNFGDDYDQLEIVPVPAPLGASGEQGPRQVALRRKGE